MRWKLVSLLVGSRWRTFCGLSEERFRSLARTALDSLDYAYTVEEMETTSGEQAMLGSDEAGSRIAVSVPAAFEIEVVDAKIDPATNIAMSFLLPEDRTEEMTADLCVVTLSPVAEETRSTIARFMTRLIAESDRPPWKLTHHIKFRLAVLLRIKVKLLWGYWREIEDSQPTA
jgi:hypothetical protein